MKQCYWKKLMEKLQIYNVMKMDITYQLKEDKYKTISFKLKIQL